MFLFRMNLWSIDHFLNIFDITFGWVQQQTHPKVMTRMFKKCSTDQRFIRKRNTTYRIHTLVCKLQCSICSQATRISYAQVHSTINNTFSITSFRISFGMTSNCLIFNTKIWQHSKILICESVVWGRPDHSRVCETLIWKSSN